MSAADIIARLEAEGATVEWDGHTLTIRVTNPLSPELAAEVRENVVALMWEVKARGQTVDEQVIEIRAWLERQDPETRQRFIADWRRRQLEVMAEHGVPRHVAEHHMRLFAEEVGFDHRGKPPLRVVSATDPTPSA